MAEQSKTARGFRCWPVNVDVKATESTKTTWKCEYSHETATGWSWKSAASGLSAVSLRGVPLVTAFGKGIEFASPAGVKCDFIENKGICSGK